MTTSRRTRPGAALALASCALLACGRYPAPEPARAPATTAAGPGGVTEAPRPGPAPELRLPPVQRFQLANGLEVFLVEQHELPVVDLELVVRTGAAADAPAQAGRASLTAELLDEGTATRSALELADAIDYLGASLETDANWDGSLIGLHVLTARLESALELMAEVALRPAFAAEELERKREERLTTLLQQLDDARTLASRAFASVLYGAGHPYGVSPLGTRESVGRLTREQLVAFYQRYYRPNNAFLIVVGDVTAAALRPLLERAFAGWQAAAVPAVELPAPPARDRTVIYVVDKPGAAQSEVRIGQVGVARSTPDYFPLLVMNTILGGAFTSRLNTQLREEKGYSYGASSRFEFRGHAGPFLAGAGVFTGVTDSALVVFLQEIRKLRDEPVPLAELERAKNYITLGLPARFETTGDIAAQVADVALFNLPADYFNTYVARVRAVTAADVQRVARQYLEPDRFAIVVAGDRAQIEAKLQALGMGPVEVREVQ